jgi:hypothetical protein
MSERDKFLTEAMGECWHEWIPSNDFDGMACKFCEDYEHESGKRNNFSTWEGFGKLWNWAQKQEWWGKFEDLIFYGKADPCGGWFDTLLIHPDRFADAIFSYLKEKTNES